MAASRGEHARCPEGSLINNRYKVVRECGCGNFSKVFRCVDTQSPKKTVVAVKLLKREYATDAKFENDMLKHIGAHDKHDEHKLLKMKEFFVWNRHPCFVFPLKGPSLRSRKLSVTRGHVPRSEFKQFAFEMIAALSFMHHQLRLVHTDLKPENILLDGDATSGLGNGWTIADFGSASFYKPPKLDSDLISTRPYRAPEVVLGNGWCYRADVWSMACILFEVFTGTRLFEVHDDVAHLQHFVHRIGKLPEMLTHKAKHSKRYFDAQGNILPVGSRSGVHGGLPRAAAATGASSASPVKAISEVLAGEPELLDLLAGMLHFDPARRTTAREALQHAFFEGFGSRSSTGVAAPPPAASGAEAATFSEENPRLSGGDAHCGFATRKSGEAAPRSASSGGAAAAPRSSASSAPSGTTALSERALAKENMQAAAPGLATAIERLKIRQAQAAAAFAAAAPPSGRCVPGLAAGKPTPRSNYAPTRLW